MKYLNDAEVMRGDDVLALTPDGFAVVGKVHEIVDRNQTIRISGYPIQVKAADTLLATYAYKTAAKPLLEQAIAMAPGVPEMRYHYAEVLAATGDRAGAKRWLDEALRGGVTLSGRDAALKLRESLMQ